MRNENLPELIAQTAKTIFGIESLYPEQTEIISRIIESSKNRICILPTGRGKTFCFVIPALLLDGITIVVYPLLALMSDQNGGWSLITYRVRCFAADRTLTKEKASFVICRTAKPKSCSQIQKPC